MPVENSSGMPAPGRAGQRDGPAGLPPGGRDLPEA